MMVYREMVKLAGEKQKEQQEEQRGRDFCAI